METLMHYSSSNQSFASAVHKSTQTDASFDYEFLENLGKITAASSLFIL